MYRNSFIKFFEESETGYLEIVYAEIDDGRIVSTLGSKVGTNKTDFSKKLFVNPVDLNKIGNVKMISLLEEINHNYHFNKHTVSSIIIDTDYLFDKH